MNSELAFRRDINMYPTDKMHRLIYADWLEEQGESCALGMRYLTQYDLFPAQLTVSATNDQQFFPMEGPKRRYVYWQTMLSFHVVNVVAASGKEECQFIRPEWHKKLEGRTEFIVGHRSYSNYFDAFYDLARVIGNYSIEHPEWDYANDNRILPHK